MAASYNTSEVVRKIRKAYQNVPIIATGGKTDETVEEVILAGANAVTFTPPATNELFKELMATYRNE